MFSQRTQWNLTRNKLSILLEEKKSQGKRIIDLTESNPTRCGIQYPEKEILASFQKNENLIYEPHPQGLLSARGVITDYYQDKSIDISLEKLFLTASTSEGYSFLLRLLTNPGDSILIPHPSYPLFSLLAEINDVELQPYQLVYEDSWRIDFDSLENIIGHRTKAIILVNPNNPTGSFLKQDEYIRLTSFCLKHNIVIISDEVFSDYSYGSSQLELKQSLLGNAEVLTFVLNGISKILGLPQMKLGWLAIDGPPGKVKETISRLEIIADTFLSISTPIQHAFPDLMKLRNTIQSHIIGRVGNNLAYLTRNRDTTQLVTHIPSEGGWYAVLSIPKQLDEEQLVLKLLKNHDTHIHPGYFFDFKENGYLVLSLLTEEKDFQEGFKRLIRTVQTQVT